MIKATFLPANRQQTMRQLREVTYSARPGLTLKLLASVQRSRATLIPIYWRWNFPAQE